MKRDRMLQSCLVALAAVVIVVGASTFSFKKMLVTYFLGLLGIAGILLPDWEFFDRDVSQWFTPLQARRGASSNVDLDAFRFTFSPLRVVVIAIIYGFGLYKWWMFVIS